MMESIILQDLESKFPTIDAQQAKLTELVSTFGELPENEIKSVVGDILCLARMVFEGGNEKIVFQLRQQLLTHEMHHSEQADYINKLEYLNKCFTNFKLAIFKNIQDYFSQKYSVDPSLVVCLPKITGQQIGAKVEIKYTSNDKNPIIFHVKSHQEFCSKSHPQYIAITSDGTGKVDFKELFMYKVLEYIGYGPKTDFIIDKDISKSRVDEGILIATQDLSCTKHPDKKEKSFKTFRETRENLVNTSIQDIDQNTKSDIIAIDMLSRAFLLEDVMINQGNFGEITSTLFESSSSLTKWKIVDFISPTLRAERGDDYSYAGHYPGGVNIFHSFRIGNASHTYDREELEIICLILSEEHSKALWLPTIKRLSQGRQNHVSVAIALEKAFEDISAFMTKNKEVLQIKPDRLERRMNDLSNYKNKIMQNFNELEQGIQEYLKPQTSSTTHFPT